MNDATPSEERPVADYYDKYWNRCDWCGRFIAYEDFGPDGPARRDVIPPDINEAWESYETCCGDCIDERKKLNGSANYENLAASNYHAYRGRSVLQNNGLSNEQTAL